MSPPHGLPIACFLLFKSRSIQMNLDRCAVKTYHFGVNLDYPFCLQCGKYSAEYTVLAPSAHANVYCMPISVGFRQRPSFAAVLRDIQDRINQLEIAHTDIAALGRKILRYLLVLFLRNLHVPIIPEILLLLIV